jgi:hypothetical protein
MILHLSGIARLTTAKQRHQNPHDVGLTSKLRRNWIGKCRRICATSVPQCLNSDTQAATPASCSCTFNSHRMAQHVPVLTCFHNLLATKASMVHNVWELHGVSRSQEKTQWKHCDCNKSLQFHQLRSFSCLASSAAAFYVFGLRSASLEIHSRVVCANDPHNQPQNSAVRTELAV